MLTAGDIKAKVTTLAQKNGILATQYEVVVRPPTTEEIGLLLVPSDERAALPKAEQLMVLDFKKAPNGPGNVVNQRAIDMIRSIGGINTHGIVGTLDEIGATLDTAIAKTQQAPELHSAWTAKKLTGPVYDRPAIQSR